MTTTPGTARPISPIDRIIRFCLDNKLVTALIAVALVLAGLIVAPFDWQIEWLPREPVSVDAIPDIGENQQVVFTDWMGRSPQDVEDQVTYPLTAALLGIPRVKSVRSYSMFGFSTVYVIFEERAGFYWSRSRVMEKLTSLAPGMLPEGVKPALGPDATALGQVFWYTLEGRDPQGNPAGGWDPQELRSIQDFHVRYALASAEGVSEVASVGGFVKEYQVDVDPAAMRAHDVMLEQVYDAVRRSNRDVGARTVEINKVEYVIRGAGLVRGLADLEQAVVRVTGNVPVRLKDVARVSLGPALRGGALDKEGAEAVGGVVVARFGANPLAVIRSVKARIAEIAPGLPEKRLGDGRVSKVTVVPFYDRTGLIRETLGTLNDAIFQEVLITVLVILVMVNHLGSSVLISSVLPLAVLLSFTAMKLFGVDANIVSLSGIAIAIGTVVDMGIVLTENTLRHLERAGPDEPVKEVVFRAASEVGGAILTAVSTTVVSFFPVFMMSGAEGKLFKPLAFTKTFALASSIIVALTLVPSLAQIVFERRRTGRNTTLAVGIVTVVAGVLVMVKVAWWVGLIAAALGLRAVLAPFVSARVRGYLPTVVNVAVIAVFTLLLTVEWHPFGAGEPLLRNLALVVVSVGGFLLLFRVFARAYPRVLGWLLDRKYAFVVPALGLVLLGATIWLGFGRLFAFAPSFVKRSPPFAAAAHAFPGLGREFMPPLDEGSFLYMPTTMAHASLGAAQDILREQTTAIRAIPEVESVVGKVGRVESALDPAPTSMFETVITVKPEFAVDENGRRMLFRYDRRSGAFARDSAGELIPDPRGKPWRNWRERVRSMDDIWDEIAGAARMVGVTGAPRLQPIAARVVMLQSGMRSPMGLKVRGPDLATIERVGLEVERLLKEVPSVDPGTVVADRVAGKPYLDIEIDREAIGRYGLSVDMVQDVIEMALGGMTVTTTIEGRERYGVRIRYPRELRGDPEAMARVAVPTPGGAQVPLGQLARIVYRRGPEMIKAEETFLTGYVLFDKRPGRAEVDVVQEAAAYLEAKRASGELVIPPGVSYVFAGTYENQVRSARTLRVVLPLALLVIFLILYFQFRRVALTTLVFSTIVLAWSGGFLLIWLYGQPWFLDLTLFGANLRDVLRVHPVNLSVAIWVGFLALFGIASDDGVLMCTYLEQRFAAGLPQSVAGIRSLVVEGATRRVRPALMTTATTILALLPVLTAAGRGADIMIPMAIPSFGGMVIELLTLFQAPVAYCWLKERELVRRDTRSLEPGSPRPDRGASAGRGS